MANRPPQRTVRVGQLERTLASFNEEMGVKVAASLARYHGEKVAPLEERLGGDVAEIRAEIDVFAESTRDDLRDLRERCDDLEEAIAWMRLPWWRRAWLRAWARWTLWRDEVTVEQEPFGLAVVPVGSLAPDVERD